MFETILSKLASLLAATLKKTDSVIDVSLIFFKNCHNSSLKNTFGWLFLEYLTWMTSFTANFNCSPFFLQHIFSDNIMID